MSDDDRTLSERFAEALGGYLAGDGEQALNAAYELGRESLESGRGVLSHTALLHRALLLVAKDRPGGLAETVERSGPFLLECYSPFEMAHRGARDTNAVLRRLDQVREEQFKRLAHELHDEAGQMLAAVYLDLDRVAAGMAPETREGLASVRARLREVEVQLRRISHEMRPPALDDLGLVPALNFLAEGVGRRAGLAIEVESALDDRLRPEVEIVLYRAAQEALTNVARHARATRAVVRLERGEDGVVLTVSDDGVGFDVRGSEVPSQPSGIGITGIRERVASIGGTLEIASSPGEGTLLRIPIPLVEHAANTAG